MKISQEKVALQCALEDVGRKQERLSAWPASSDIDSLKLGELVVHTHLYPLILLFEANIFSDDTNAVESSKQKLLSPSMLSTPAKKTRKSLKSPNTTCINFSRSS